MFFKKKLKKFDRLITTLIVWWAIASIFWASRTKKWKKITQKVSDWLKSIFRKWFNFSGKTVVYVVKFFSGGKK